MYKGEVYHVQTEDSGVKNPHIITLLYQGGTILSSKKTSYADIVTFENLDLLVDELMKEQHKGMLRGLKGGEFDSKIAAMNAPAAAAVATAAPAPVAAAVVEAPVAAVGAQEEELVAADDLELAEVPVAGDEVTDMDDLLALLEVQVEKKPVKSLDDAILDFFAIK
jgi:hypothetical protein